MDERTRTSDDELAPNLRRTAPEPGVISRPYSKLRIGLGLAIAIGLGIAAYVIVHTARAPQPTTSRFAAGSLQSVGAATVATGNIRVMVNALGTVTPIATVTVQTQINGQLTEVAFTEGQLVNKGDFLAQIDARPYEIVKAQYEGQLAHDQGLLAQAQMDLKRYQGLVAQNSIARQQAEDQVFLVQQYQGTVKLDQAQVDAQALNIAYCHIVSPVTGRVGLRLVDPGNYVQTSSSSSIAVVTQLQPITVIFSVPEDDLPDIMPQFNAGTTLQVTAYDRANVNQLAIGKVSAVDNQIDTTTGTVKVRAQFDNADNALFPNQFVNARLLVETLQNVVTVPTVGDPARLARRVVCLRHQCRQHRLGAADHDRPDRRQPDRRQFRAAAGDRVVVDGTDRLRDGLHVNVASDRRQAAGAAAGAGRRTGNGAGGQDPERRPFAESAQQRRPIAVPARRGSARARR